VTSLAERVNVLQLVTMEGCGVGGKVSASEHRDLSAELPACSFPQSQQQSTCQSMSRDLCAACCSQPSYAMTPAHCTVATPLASEGNRVVIKQQVISEAKHGCNRAA
jgi:hypothetical protein